MGQETPAQVVNEPAAPAQPDEFTAMTPKFGRLAQAFGERFFSGFRFEPGDAQRLRDLEQRGAVVYVMRYSSRLDYFLFNWLFLKERIRLSAHANGIRFYYYRPLLEAARLLVRGAFMRLRRGYRRMRERGIHSVDEILLSGGSMFLFLRTDKLGSRIRATRRGAVASGRSELDYLEEIVGCGFREQATINLVPLALFWRKGARQRRRFLNVFYGAPVRPTDTGKVLSFLWNYGNLAVRVGTPIDLRAFIDEQGKAGPDSVVKKVRRSLLIFLRREEKPVVGPALRPVDAIEHIVIADEGVQRAIREQAAESRRSEARIERRARKQLREIAAHPSPTMLAILDVIVGRIFKRLFDRIDVHGLDRVVEAAKMHPLVLAPAHRSHFDYLILSWLFYEQHLVPPLVAAGVNLSFWPLGPIFRRGGGFFLRRSFEGDRLYAAVFERYVRQLIKDGLTQEFFIEGTRSRSGRTLPPRLGMLDMVLEAYSRGVRRDVQIIPVGFTYERLVEEGSMAEERRGKAKAGENLRGLLGARRVLQRRFGTVTVRLGEPISLADMLGPMRERGMVERRRNRVQRLGTEISRRINALVTASPTGVIASVLLSSGAAGIRREDLVVRAHELVAMLELLDLAISDAVKADLSADLESTLQSLEAGDLVVRRRDRQGEIVHVEGRARDVLDYYRNALTPTLAIPGALALGLEAGRKDARTRAAEWLDLIRLECFPPRGEEQERLFSRVLDHFRLRGWTDATAPNGDLKPTDGGSEPLRMFAAQVLPILWAYGALFESVADSEGTGTRKGWLDDARGVLERALLLGDLRLPEASNRLTLDNALTLLLERGVLSCAGNPRRADARFDPGPRWGELTLLRDRLAQAFASV